MCFKGQLQYKGDLFNFVRSDCDWVAGEFGCLFDNYVGSGCDFAAGEFVCEQKITDICCTVDEGE